MGRRLRLLAVVVAFLVGAFALMGEGSEDNSSGGGNSEKSSSDASEAPAVGKTRESPVPVGTPVSVAKGWEVTVNSANLNANQIAADANQFNKPDPGNVFVLVNVTIKNGSDTPAMPLTSVKLSLLPESGIAASNAFVAQIPDEIDTTAQMQPGAVASGNLIFQVKEAEASTSVLLGEPQFTLDENKDQRFFALQ